MVGGRLIATGDRAILVARRLFFVDHLPDLTIAVVHQIRCPEGTVLTSREAHLNTLNWLTSEGQLVLRVCLY